MIKKINDFLKAAENMNKKMLMDTFDLFDKNDVVVKNRYIKANNGVAPHWHDYFELEIILDGAAEQVYNGEKIMMKRGYAYLLSYCDFHAVRAVCDTRLINIRFKENLINKELLKIITSKKPGKLLCVFDEKEIKSALDKIKIIDSEIKGDKMFKNIEISSVISQMLIMILRKSQVRKNEFTPQIIQTAVSYINANFRDKLTKKKLATKLLVSENYLGTLFKKHLKMTFNEYINNVRLKYACNLLLGSQMTAAEIAFASGYSSGEYFSYVFKSKMKKTPGEYRNSQKMF